jgi:hypothetical protein
MPSKKKLAAASVATFGAAMSTMYLAPSAQADIVDLFPSPGSVAYGGGGYVGIIPGGATYDWFQWNDGIGKTFYPIGDLAGINLSLLGYSNYITNGAVFYSGIGAGPSLSGTYTFGFLTTAGQVGWIKVNFGGAGGPVTYLAAAYETDVGTGIHIGTGASAIPEPSSFAALGLGALALGAVGVRRMRKGKKVA